MNTPITLKFFKKIELFQELTFQNKLFKRSLLDPDKTHSTKSTWEVEKKVLYWTRWGHKHLGSPLTFQRFHTKEDLQDMKLTEKEAETAGLEEFMRNLMRRGFAEKYANNDNFAGVYITERGLLFGALVYEIYKPKLIRNQNLWRLYKNNSNAETYLSKKYIYWFYELVILLGWLVFAAAAILAFWALIDKIIGVLK